MLKKIFFLKKNNSKIKITSFDVKHGKINSTAYVVGKLAYISDCNHVFTKDLKKLSNLKYLVIDCLKFNKHQSHFNLEEAVLLSKKTKAKNTILTNLHSDLDYELLKKTLPKNIYPAFDGMTLNI